MNSRESFIWGGHSRSVTEGVVSITVVFGVAECACCVSVASQVTVYTRGSGPKSSSMAVGCSADHAQKSRIYVDLVSVGST